MSEGGQGPLAGLRVVEMAGLGPTPFAAMWLADMGADVVRVQRPGLRPLIPLRVDVLNRGRGHVVLDLKNPDDLAQARALIDRAEILIEGMRAGVMERLGLGPEDFAKSNPALIYGRMTGWGQTGPLAHMAGHDINYIGLTGALHAIGPAEQPVPPLNLVGDFGGGAMYLVAGLLAALNVVHQTGKGQVVDCAITDGAAHLMAMIYGMHGSDIWSDRRQENLLDGGAPYYATYECACGGFMAVGALEPQFYSEFLGGLGLVEGDLPDRLNPMNWPDLRRVFADIFRQKSRDEWSAVFAGSDACVTPVLTLQEAPSHPHNQARASFTRLDDIAQPGAVPKLSDTTGAPRPARTGPPRSAAEVIARWS